jgi:hypothetical protein
LSATLPPRFPRLEKAIWLGSIVAGAAVWHLLDAEGLQSAYRQATRDWSSIFALVISIWAYLGAVRILLSGFGVAQPTPSADDAVTRAEPINVHAKALLIAIVQTIIYLIIIAVWLSFVFGWNWTMRWTF